jgi:peroxiredoxin
MILFKKISIFLLSLSMLFPSFLNIYDEDFLQLSYSQQQLQEQQQQQQNDVNAFTVKNLSDNERDSTYPQTDSVGNNVYMVWQDNLFGHNRMNYDILLKTSTDGGQTFGEVVNLSNNSGFSEHPQIAVNGTNVYIVWADNTSLNRDIYFISSNDGGQTFGEVVNLSNNTADSYNQEISVSGDNVYVTWLDSQKYLQGDNKISFISSNDGGQTFGDVINLSNNAEKSSFPKISSFEDNVYITWNIDSDSEDKSISLNNDGRVSGNISSINGNSSNIASEGIYFIKSSDGGNSFGKEMSLTTDEKPGEAQIAANGNNVYIIWGSPDPSTVDQIEDESSNETSSEGNQPNSGDGIYFVKSTDNGNSFLKPQFIKEGFKNPLNVEIIENAGQLIIAIQATPINNTIEGNQEIFLINSQDQGNTFSDATNISNNGGISECPSMTIPSDNSLFLVWQDRSPGNNEVFSTKINL